MERGSKYDGAGVGGSDVVMLRWCRITWRDTSITHRKVRVQPYVVAKGGCCLPATRHGGADRCTAGRALVPESPVCTVWR